MRIIAFAALVAYLLSAPALSLADEQPDASQAVDDAADVQPVVDSAPAMTTRDLDPPTSVAPFSAAPQDASEETSLPLDLLANPPQPLPPGPPNRLP
jgi:hypothetical protein